MATQQEWNSIPEILQAAKATLPAPLWYFSGSGPESEITVRRNRAAFDHVGFVPRVMRNVARRDTSTKFLGNRLFNPVMTAPVSYVGSFHPDGAGATARVAARVGTTSFVAANSSPSLEEVRAAAEGPMVFQHYAWGSLEWQERLIRKVENAGYDALCITVDEVAGAPRDRYLPAGFEARRRAGNTNPNLEPIGEGPDSVPAQGAEREEYVASFTWEEFDKIRDLTKLPVILKGIMSPLDAQLAVEHGTDVIYVSNHGGRRQDHVVSSIEMLPQVAQAVHGRAEIIVDSGFIRGTDVVKALAMGASSVLIGKLMLWALAAGGEYALERTLELLQQEVNTTMGMMGASTVDELTPDLVMPTFAPPPAPWPVEPMVYPEA